MRVTASLAVWLMWATAVLGGGASDSFDRADNDTVGKAPKGEYRWVEIGEKDPHAVRIAENLLWLDYNTGPSSQASANLDGFTAADVEIRVKVSAWYGDDVRVCGVSYRMDSAQGGFDAEGYHALLNKEFVRLTYGTNVVAEKKGSFTPKELHDVRVIAHGKSHKVFVDGTLCLDTTDERKLTSGHVGLTEYYEQARFDDFSVSDAEAGGTKPKPLPATNSDANVKKKSKPRCRNR